MPELISLDNLEVRTPIVEFPTRQGTPIGLQLTGPWQRRFESLWRYVQRKRAVREVSTSRNIAYSERSAILLATGTITLTLPAAEIGDTFYVFNYGSGVITIAGTINGNALGYQLTNQYQYAEFTNVDGSNWIVTINN